MAISGTRMVGVNGWPGEGGRAYYTGRVADVVQAELADVVQAESSGTPRPGSANVACSIRWDSLRSAGTGTGRLERLEESVENIVRSTLTVEQSRQ